MAQREILDIEIPYPTLDDRRLELEVGACKFNMNPSDDEHWVRGTYEHDGKGTIPRIDQYGNRIVVSQGKGLSTNFNFFGGRSPRFNLGLGKRRPFALAFSAGATDAQLDLGGVPLTDLQIEDGAGRLHLDFSSPNPQRLEHLRLNTGAGKMTMLNLLNANFQRLTLEGGAAAYQVDFGGILTQDAEAKISVGMSQIGLTIPRSTSAKIIVESKVLGRNVSSELHEKDNAYYTEAALQDPQAPQLTIVVEVGMGALSIQTRDNTGSGD